MRYFDNNIYSCAGSPVRTVYEPVLNDDGSIDLVAAGVENTDEEIQSYAESCDLNIILAKYLNGDTSVLNRYSPMFGDFTNMPKTYAEALQKKIDAERMFSELPIEVRKKFDNDINKFYVQAGTEEWFENLGVKFEKNENVKESEESLE